VISKNNNIELIIESLAKKLVFALGLLKKEKDLRKNDGRMISESKEFLMILEMMDKGVFYLYTISQVLSLTEDEREEFLISGVLDNIQYYCELIKSEMS